MTNEQPTEPAGVLSTAGLGVITRTEVIRLADAFQRSAEWLGHGKLEGPARTHPLVGIADYKRAATIMRAAAFLWAHSETEG